MVQLLSHINCYVTLSQEEVDILTRNLFSIKIDKNQNLFEAGEICDCNYFVSKGCLRMYFTKENGVEHTTQFAIENWWIADYLSLLNRSESPFTLESIEPSEVIAIQSRTADFLTTEIPKLNTYFNVITQRAYAAAQMRIKFLQEYSGEELFSHFTSLFPEFLQRVPQYMMASYLGFSPEYYSRLRKKIKKGAQS